MRIPDEGTLPTYTRAQVADHDGSKEDSVWVTFEGRVYDITEFIANHPGGGDKIKLAAGKDVAPFWRIYQQHMNKPYVVQEVLKPMLIGNLDSADVAAEAAAAAAAGDDDDPYAGDPPPHPAMIVHSVKPLQLEIPKALMMQEYVTPLGLSFVRNHHPVPRIDADAHQLEISVQGPEPAAGAAAVRLSLRDLQQKFQKVTITSSMQCGGNRRSGFDKDVRAKQGTDDIDDKTMGLQWDIGAISTAKWSGARLKDVLQYAYRYGAGPQLTRESARGLGIHHVIFKSVDGLEASIPSVKALDELGDCVLAWEMNGEPIPPEHGFPLRVIVPGVVGVRNVKWLSHIVLSDVEAEGAWQRGISYKGFAPGVKTFEGINVEAVHSIQEQPVTSCIVQPSEEGGASALEAFIVEEEDGYITLSGVSGYAFSGGGKGIVRVDVSGDGGETWTTATLTDGNEQPPDRSWAWTFWTCDEIKARVDDRGERCVELMCRATDASYNTQPESSASIWNIRGLNNNSYHRVRLRL